MNPTKKERERERKKGDTLIKLCITVSLIKSTNYAITQGWIEVSVILDRNNTTTKNEAFENREVRRFLHNLRSIQPVQGYNKSRYTFHPQSVNIHRGRNAGGTCTCRSNMTYLHASILLHRSKCSCKSEPV